MVSTLDPTTGLPMVSGLPSDFIEQIPLDSQVMPWSDYGATQRPGRGPAYPDDILPTNSIINGQNQNNPQAPQTVYTDGNHNLRVSVVGAGAGPVSSGYNRSSSAINQDAADGVHNSYTNSVPSGHLIYYVSWSAVLISLTGSNAYAAIQLDLIDSGGANIHIDLFMAGKVGDSHARLIPFTPALDVGLSGLIGAPGTDVEALGGHWRFSFYIAGAA
jgi:hypothetical protein